MTISRTLVLAGMAACAMSAWAALNEREPHIGYLYPSGGRQGAVVQVTIGGQHLNGVNGVHVTGEGVSASVVQHGRSFNRKQMQEIRVQLNDLIRERRAAMSPGNNGPAQNPDAPKTEPVSLPDHPLFRNLPTMSPKELECWMAQFFMSNKRQMNAQLGEMVIVEVTIAQDTAEGSRELRLVTPAGLTNPLRFEVGSVPEVCEREPNDRDASNLAPLEPPVVLNGQIMPGDVDRFHIQAQAGQRLVIEAQARRLMPYLADAVPGWFQAVLTLRGANAKEVAFSDSHRFDPDPILFYEIPEDGEYEIEVRDSIYRGREDFVYRVTIGEKPFITDVFPVGGRAGAKTVAKIKGWNLAAKRLPLDTRPDADYVRQTALRQGEWLSNSISYAVDALPEQREREPNDSIQRAKWIELPRIINGRIERPGDVDVFRVSGRGGDQVVAEVYARRVGSPLDSLLKLTDASGRVLECNDDREDKESGLLTHHADSYLCAKLPENGVYFVYLSDSQRHGGEEYAYRLRIGAPRPDFALRLTPSSISVPIGRVIPAWVYIFRKDGFDGDIELVLKDAPEGFALSGGRIPHGKDSVRVTLTAPAKQIGQPAVLRLEGRARIGQETVSRPVVPAEDMMQAFAYRHLVPSRELVVSVTGVRRGIPIAEMTNEVPLRIPEGNTAQARFKTPRPGMLQDMKFELNDPPKGVTLQDSNVGPEGLTLTLKADGDAAKAGLADNLIVEAVVVTAGGQQVPGKVAVQPQRQSLGPLPAIPIEIVPK